ncbi:uncharacterized protein LOC116417153 [Nasonia vitripennis]|uniref:Uncharacterized protein n=1 Tax=Nasonia vitripennis TaxID=7425 RepID=A0A7M7T9F4_NASVI|nr:uncharacterized protein LOC116417153 [Nasonia vitripennis]
MSWLSELCSPHSRWKLVENRSAASQDQGHSELRRPEECVKAVQIFCEDREILQMFWKNESKCSLVLTKNTRIRRNCVEAKWRGDWYPAEILQSSDNKTDLLKINVMADGSISDCGRVKSK